MHLPGVQEALGRRRPALDHQVAVGLARAHRAGDVHAPHALEHEGGHVEVDRDLLPLRQDRVLEVELPLVPLEDAEDDLADLGLHRPPQLVRRQGAHLHEHAALSAPLGQRADRGLVLVRGDLALAQQHLAEAVARQVARPEDDAPAPEIEGLSRAAGGERQDAGRARGVELVQEVRKRQAGEAAPQTAGDGERLEALGGWAAHQRGGRRSWILGGCPTGVKDRGQGRQGRPTTPAPPGSGRLRLTPV